MLIIVRYSTTHAYFGAFWGGRCSTPLKSSYESVSALIVTPGWISKSYWRSRCLLVVQIAKRLLPENYVISLKLQYVIENFGKVLLFPGEMIAQVRTDEITRTYGCNLVTIPMPKINQCGSLFYRTSVAWLPHRIQLHISDKYNVINHIIRYSDKGKGISIFRRIDRRWGGGGSHIDMEYVCACLLGRFFSHKIWYSDQGVSQII